MVVGNIFGHNVGDIRHFYSSPNIMFVSSRRMKLVGNVSRIEGNRKGFGGVT